MMALNIYNTNHRKVIRRAAHLWCRALKNNNKSQRCLGDILTNNSIIAQRFESLATHMREQNNRKNLWQFTRALDFIDDNVRQITQYADSKVQQELFDLIFLPIEQHFTPQ